MRNISALLIVALFSLLVGCSGTPSQVDRETSTVKDIDIYGYIAWSGISNPPAGVQVQVILSDWRLADEGSYWVYQPDGAYYRSHTVNYYGDGRYEFLAIAPDGYTVTSTNPVVFDPLEDNPIIVNFTIEAD